MNELFEVHKLNERGLGNAATIAKAFDALLGTLNEVCPIGREYAITKTKLEEACFYAKKSMARDERNQA